MFIITNFFTCFNKLMEKIKIVMNLHQKIKIKLYLKIKNRNIIKNIQLNLIKSLFKLDKI